MPWGADELPEDVADALARAVAVVADGRVGLDEPANAQLRTIRLADDAVTVRQLLSHTGGVDSPASMFADRVPELVSVTGPVAPCGGSRGTFAYGYGEYAMLGQLIADVTGSSYEDAATRMVLSPLGMSASWFPPAVPATGVITGHRLTDEGVFEPEPARLSVVPSVGGLWTTAADLVRFGTAWSSLLPDALAREALRPQAEHPGGEAGLGWMLVRAKDVAASRCRPRLLRVGDHPTGHRPDLGRRHQPEGRGRTRQRTPGPPDRLSGPAPGAGVAVGRRGVAVGRRRVGRRRRRSARGRVSCDGPVGAGSIGGRCPQEQPGRRSCGAVSDRYPQGLGVLKTPTPGVGEQSRSRKTSGAGRQGGVRPGRGAGGWGACSAGAGRRAGGPRLLKGTP